MDFLSPHIPNYKFHPKVRARIWDGREKLYMVDGERSLLFPKGLEQRLAEKFDLKISLPEPIITREKLLSFIETLNIPMTPFDYQIDAVLETLNERRKTILLPTGSGKSLVIYIISRFMMAWNKKTVLIVPNVMLVNQMYSDFRDYGFKDLENYVHQICAGKEKHFEKPITITTWQSIYKSKELFEDIHCILVDEAHGCAAQSLKDVVISASNTPYRIGLTGTLPEEYISKMYLEGALGQSKRYLTTKKLIEMGLATPVEIYALFLKYPDDVCKAVLKMDYQKENQFLNEYSNRKKFIVKLADKISKQGNTLCLFSKVENHGVPLVKEMIKQRVGESAEFIFKLTKNELLAAIISKKELIYVNDQVDEAKIKRLLSGTEYASQYKEVYKKVKSLEELQIFVVTGVVDEKQREYIRRILEQYDNAILFASYATMSTGVNIKKLRHLILGESTKSSIRLLQSIGRMLRLHDSKDKVGVWDIVDDCGYGKKQNYCLKHFFERLAEYQEQEFDLFEKEVNIQ
jgi:superfamily II DNA or RNA helicase